MKAAAVAAAADAAVADAEVDVEAAAEVAVVVEVNYIKNKLMKPKHVTFLPVMAGYLLLPCLFGGLFLASWVPFQLAGKQFLVWYIVYMASGHLLLYVANRYTSLKANKLANIFLWMTLIISAGRMCQGLYHHKPILFLCLLTGLNTVLLVLWKRDGMAG